ncbi:tRNA(Met)-cytidine N(4)-acetyltransferase [Marinomonas alcarazii]|uniref:tRNA(Met) cytidine acetyltransferase TmcA n=2 Tax=Marinomonas alcarazii TaxID=491949 RepID=A0A318UZD4_9GAMM|nr:tRNA(Met)-cytidine N(4)-acetyltransferase [Marinomonas alcarazii]
MSNAQRRDESLCRTTTREFILMSDNHRHCFILKGSPREVLPDFLQLCENFSTPLIAAHDVSQYDELLIPSLKRKPFKTCAFKQTRQELGSCYDAVLVDLTQGVSASALAILSGTVRGNGLFAVVLPHADWLSMADQELSRYLPWPYEPEQVYSNFKRYLLDHLKNTSPFQELKAHQVAPLPALTLLDDNAPLTDEQANAQACLFAEQAQSYVLIAPRGRGKSTLLGDSLAKLVQAGKRVAITAPNQDAIVSLKARFESHFEANTVTLPFYAPDALMDDSNQWDFLFVDEASMIPLPLLMALNQKANHCLFSTTDYGYEGSGKGFGIRFCQHLASQKTTKPLALQPLVLSQPIRWGENDPLENWINNTLLLAPKEQAKQSFDTRITFPIKDDITNKMLVGKDWIKENNLLHDTFQLLVSAHYQTSADNLRWVLDDPSVTSFISMTAEQIHSVAIVTEEGHLPEDLSLAVMQGKRRPRGHLVPQSLLAHEGFENAGQYGYWRISRIATEQSQQNKGLASQLLSYIEKSANTHCDFLCSSFAATPDVLSFWLKNDFLPVRLGTAKDQASGSYSIMMVKPLTQLATQQAIKWQSQLLEELLMNLLLQYDDLSVELILLILKQYSFYQSDIPSFVKLTAQDAHNLALFVDHHRPFDSIRPAFFKKALSLALQGQLIPKEPSHQLLLEAALGRNTEQTRRNANLTGKKAMHQSFKKLLSTVPPSK